MAIDYWNGHIEYLEDEVKNLNDRADKLEKMIAGLTNEQKKHSLQELVNHLRDESNDHRKYLLLVKPK
jgi:hypothetical protein